MQGGEAPSVDLSINEIAAFVVSAADVGATVAVVGGGYVGVSVAAVIDGTVGDSVHVVGVMFFDAADALVAICPCSWYEHFAMLLLMYSAVGHLISLLSQLLLLLFLTTLSL